jgi:hypothetical protein
MSLTRPSRHALQSLLPPDRHSPGKFQTRVALFGEQVKDLVWCRSKILGADSSASGVAQIVGRCLILTESPASWENPGQKPSESSDISKISL